jgi:cell division protein ZapA
MASIEVDVAGRRYDVACRDGEEAHLRSLAAIVDKRAKDAASALGGLTETRQLLFAALLIADDLKDVRAGAGLPDPTPPPPDPAVAEALERLAERMEKLADRLEGEAA